MTHDDVFAELKQLLAANAPGGKSCFDSTTVDEGLL